MMRFSKNHPFVFGISWNLPLEKPIEKRRLRALSSYRQDDLLNRLEEKEAQIGTVFVDSVIIDVNSG